MEWTVLGLAIPAGSLVSLSGRLPQEHLPHHQSKEEMPPPTRQIDPTAALRYEQIEMSRYCLDSSELASRLPTTPDIGETEAGNATIDCKLEFDCFAP